MSDCFQGAGIAFDLDGTLVDTAPDLVRALNAVVAEDGLQGVALADVRIMVGRGARVLIERAYSAQDRRLDPDIVDTKVQRFIDVYKAGIANLSSPFPRCIETLDFLAGKGARLSVCTNKPSVLADALLDALGMTHRFERVIGPDRTSAKKPDAAHFWSAVGDAGPNLALIGDSITDSACAKAAGIPCVILTHGYSEIPHQALGADAVLDSFESLPDKLAELWQGRS
ncbi:HAD-IA family hydrolase [Hyphobacterium sp. HN65]|uniref:phosphoglycolate phosphatase n=1 Tax=Hyphobacterium lacteum TaxID=3116575 RepID=A0ABU7LT72_9PROT|nr:HAD-IA family hydrolase [Hyphobacterium sp. HN65]MEE2527092.1 HAD-IA family hydrolase [Hyphobacterium sp. HN65]